MRKKSSIFILILITAGAIIGVHFQRKIPIKSKKEIAPPIHQIIGAIPTVDLVTSKSEPLNLMDSSIVEQALDPSLSRPQKFEILWTAYKRNKASDLVASYYLDSLNSISPLPNVSTVIADLNDAMTSPELKCHDLRLLETAYRDRENSDLDGITQERILSEIKILFASTDNAVANEAVTIYARQAKSDLAIEALNNAHENKIVSDSEYIKEIIFKIPMVENTKTQSALVAEMIRLAKESKSQEAATTLIGSVGLLFQYANHIKLNSDTNSELTKLLAQNEPQFQNTDNTGYDMLAAIDYCSWLASYAKSTNKSNAELPQFILDTLTSNGADAQKIVAVLLSDKKHDIVDLARKEGKLTSLQTKLTMALVQLSPETERYNLHQAALNALN